VITSISYTWIVVLYQFGSYIISINISLDGIWRVGFEECVGVHIKQRKSIGEDLLMEMYRVKFTTYVGLDLARSICSPLVSSISLQRFT
jgi:hypothetical protein